MRWIRGHNRNGQYIHGYWRRGGKRVSLIEIILQILTHLANATVVLFSWIIDNIRERQATKSPADLPGAVIPGWVIDSFPLLSRMPQLIGLDLRNLTEDKFMPQEIPFLSAFDGMKYNGTAVVHQNYAIIAQSGKSTVRSLPYWYLGVVAMNTNLEYIVQLSDRLLQVYDSLPANKVTSLHLELAMLKKNTILSTWTEAKYLANEGRHMKCRLNFHSLNQGNDVMLRYEIGGDVL